MRENRKGTRWSAQLERKVQDVWVGVFWQATTGPDHRWAVLDVWITIVPCFPVHLFFNRKPVEDLSWAAGLFVGEGNACIVRRGVNKWPYPQIAVKMLDGRATRRFGTIVNIPTYTYVYHVDPTRPVFQAAAAGSKAGAALNLLLPYLEDTDKEDQVVRIFLEADWVLERGIYVAPQGRRSAAMQGNQNVTGKTWKRRKEVAGR